MRQSIVQETPAPVCYLEQRAKHQETSSYLLAVTNKGAGRILDFNVQGLTFACHYPHYFPNELEIDILDGKNICIKKIKVRKVRECFKASSGQLANYEVLVGVEFVEPTLRQTAELECLLNTQDHKVISSPNILYIPDDPDHSLQFIPAINSIANQSHPAELWDH